MFRKFQFWVPFAYLIATLSCYFLGGLGLPPYTNGSALLGVQESLWLRMGNALTGWSLEIPFKLLNGQESFSGLPYSDFALFTALYVLSWFGILWLFGLVLDLVFRQRRAQPKSSSQKTVIPQELVLK